MKFVHVENPSKSFLLAEGIGNFEVVEAKELVSKAGNDMIKLTLKVWDKEGKSAFVFDYLVGSENMAFKTKHFVESVGKPEWYSASNSIIEGENLAGLCGKCIIGTEKERTVGEKTYPSRSKIKDYISDEIAARNTLETDDDISF